MMKDLYIFSGASEVGMAKMAFHEEIFTSKEVDVVYLPYELHCNVLPKSLSNEDIEECIKLCPSFLEVDKFHEFAKIPFHEYRRVVIWHSYDSNTLMLLYFLSYVLKRDLHYVNVCHYKREFIGKLGYDFDALNECLKFCVRMTPEEQNEYAGYYQMLLESKGNIKIVKNGIHLFFCSGQTFPYGTLAINRIALFKIGKVRHTQCQTVGFVTKQGCKNRFHKHTFLCRTV